MIQFILGKIRAAVVRIAEQNRLKAELAAITNRAMAELGSPLTMEEHDAIVGLSTKEGWTLRKHLMEIQRSGNERTSFRYTHLARFYLVRGRKTIRVTGFSW